MTPAVSIIIPLYNRRYLVRAALESVQAQISEDWEVIVVDDGSTDGSADVVRGIAAADPRVRFLDRTRDPKGACTCRNVGLAEAWGEYIVFLDSDDLLAPHCLTQRLEVAHREPECDFQVYQTERFEDGSPRIARGLWAEDTGEDHLTRFLLCDSVWQTSGPLWRRDSLKRLGGFDETLACWQDLDLHIRALAAVFSYRLHLNMPADVLYREHGGDSISQQGFTADKIRSQQHMVMTCLGLPACLATESRRAALRRLALRVAFRCLEMGLCHQSLTLLQRGAEAGVLSRGSVRCSRVLGSLVFGDRGYRVRGLGRCRGLFARWMGAASELSR